MSLIYYSIYIESIFFVSYMMYLGAVFFTRQHITLLEKKLVKPDSFKV